MARPKPLRRLKFWQRTYLVTLALFLACLFGGVFGVTVISRSQSFEARCDAFLESQHTICQAMAEDIAAVAANRPGALPDLYAYYGDRYRAEGVHIAVWKDGEFLYSNQPVLKNRDELSALQPGQRSWQVRSMAGQHIIFATTAFSGQLSGYVVSCCADMEDFFAEWRRNVGLFLALAAAVSTVFAVGLYLVLRRMYRPLRTLTETAQHLAAGELSTRAPEGRSDEMGELARTLNDMARRVDAQLAQLEAQAEGKQLLVDNLSHEMRTPLTAIAGYAEYIQRAELSPGELMDATETIRFESKRLLNLSNQLVRLSVLAHEELTLAPVAPAPLLERAVRAVAPKAEVRGVTVTALPPAAALPALLGEADLLESLLVNLADNGVKACARGGAVRLWAEAAPDGGAALCVADDGCGMSRETLAHMGEPFYRADKARSRAEGGAGIGTALCRAIAEAHGAALFYESEPGRGTTVRVEFPPEKR